MFEAQMVEMPRKLLRGECHDTLRNTGDLASAYRNRGKLKEAEMLGLRAVALCKTVSGQENRLTLGSMSGLVSTYIY